MKPTSLTDIKQLLGANGLAPLKKFGQNFLVDENITRKIADSAGTGANVLEIGTGLGALTVQLAQRAQKVVTVEVDRGLLGLHPRIFEEFDNIAVIDGDILKTDLRAAGKEYFDGEPFAVCGNLPYYITSKILLHIAESSAPVQAVTAMVQKEVAERLEAQPGDTEYGALTASLRYYGQPRLLFTVSKSCFYPVPDVDSAVIHMDMGGTLDADREQYVKTVRSAFAMRRKTIFNNLKAVAGAQRAGQALEYAGIAPGKRAQDIAPQQFAQLSKKLFSE